MIDRTFDNINLLCDKWFDELQWMAFATFDSINETLGQLIRDLENHYGKKDDHLPWDDLDRDLVFQALIDDILGSCMSDECINILAIFCLDRGLFFCQMGGLKKEAYEEYLLSAVISSKRLIE